MNNLNGWLNVDKPAGVTSNYVSTIIKRILGIKKHGTKLGFIGTLDPFATGLLTFAIGNATKCIDLIPNHYKAYEFSVEWGKHTNTYDVDGDVISTTVNIPTDASIINESQKFIGITLQSPPIFSAVKINGRRAYDLARKGKDFLTTPKNITIKDFQITSHSGVNTTFLVRCSKGCYIRSLAVDLAKNLNSLCFVRVLSNYLNILDVCRILNF